MQLIFKCIQKLINSSLLSLMGVVPPRYKINRLYTTEDILKTFVRKLLAFFKLAVTCSKC